MAGLSHLFQPVGFGQCPNWMEDDMAAAFAAFRRCAFEVLEKPYRTGSLGVDTASFTQAYEAARNVVSLGDIEARHFFEHFFVACKIAPENGAQGFVTGYYEPEIDASPVKTDDFSVPFLRRPEDLVAIDDTNRPQGLDPYFAFARLSAGELIEYYDRKTIEQGILAGRGLEIAYAQSKVDVFFAHVQGSARLKYPDGRLLRISYAAKTGHPFTAIGRILVQRGEIALADVTMQSIRQWLADHPEQVDELLWNNRSYIFFRETQIDNPHDGPIAAARVSLTAGRSVAVDRLLHSFGTPFYISSRNLQAFEPDKMGGFHRLMIAQDTGSAIIGPARGDLFAGSGYAAGNIAGTIRHEADFFALIPRALAEEHG